MTDRPSIDVENEVTIRQALTRGAAEETSRNVVFAAPPDDPRARRPADGSALVFSLLVVFLAAWAYAAETDVDRRLLDFFGEGLPGWLSAIFTTVFIAGGMYAAGLLIAILVFGHGRRAIARDMVVAAFLTLVGAAALAGVTGPEWVDILPELLERDGFPSFPLVRLAIVVAVLSAVHPYLSVPMRQLGGRVSWAMAISALAMGYGTLSAIIGAAALGTATAAIVRLLFGSGVGIPSKPRILEGLESIGLDIDSLDYWAEQPVGVTLLSGRLADGRDVITKVYGRDAADAATASRLWRALWFRDFDRALTATGLQQVEHESLMLFQAQKTSAPVPNLVGWGRGPTGDAFLVTESPDGQPMSDLSAGAIDDVLLVDCWRSLDALHRARVAHGAIDGRRIVATDAGVVIRDLSGSSISPTETLMAADVAQLLVTTAVMVGSGRAIAAAREGIGDDRLESSLPLLQANALSPSLRRDAKDAGLKLGDLRVAVSETIDTDPPELVQLERVTWTNVAITALTVFGAYAIISSLSEIGFDILADQLRNASWDWLIAAFILAQLTNVGEYVSLTGVVRNYVPFAPTIMFRYALSFIDLAVPSDAGSIAMNIRYMQKLGESTASAVAQGPLLTVFSKGFDILLLIIASQVIGQSIDIDELDTGPVLRILALAIVVLAAGLVIAFVVPRFRDRIVPPIRDALGSIRASVTDPKRLLRIAGGTLMQKILFAMTLAAAVAAYGGDLSFVEALFVNTAISLLVGLVPVPGGVGVAEAALTAGLTAVGVPQEVAVAAAISHRMVTSYLPPIFGWWASRWLTEHDYL